MNYVIFLDAQAREIEKILSGLKTMILKEFDPAKPVEKAISTGDLLFFLRNNDETTSRVRATVVRVLVIENDPSEKLSLWLKEMQSKLQLTEDQYNQWSEKGRILAVEFDAAQKIDPICVGSRKDVDFSHWIAFEKIQSPGS